MDRDGAYFNIILNFLRDPLNFDPHHLEHDVLRLVLIEADFYQITKLVAILKEVNTSTRKSTNGVVIDYQMVSTDKYSLDKLNIAVKNLLEKGWTLYGSPAANEYTWGQSLVKYA